MEIGLDDVGAVGQRLPERGQGVFGAGHPVAAMGHQVGLRFAGQGEHRRAFPERPYASPTRERNFSPIAAAAPAAPATTAAARAGPRTQATIWRSGMSTRTMNGRLNNNPETSEVTADTPKAISPPQPELIRRG